MGYPSISIIIPTYNRRHFLRNALQSVIEQDYPNLHVFVVDGGSTDDTSTMVKAFAMQYPFVHLLQNTYKSGASGAKNTAIAVLCSELFAVLDDDDILLHGALKRLAETYMQYDRQYGIILGNRLRSDTKEYTGRGIDKSREVAAEEFWFGSLSGKFFGIFQTQLIGEDRFDEELKGGDRLFWNKIYAKSKIYYLHQPMRIYSIHSDSLTQALNTQPLVEARNYEKEIAFLKELHDHHEKVNYLATLHNKLARLYLAGNEKFKAREHLKKSLSCKLGFEAFGMWLRSYVY